MVDYKIPNNKGNRYLFKIVDSISKYIWCKPPKRKSHTITTEFYKNLSNSKGRPIKLKSDKKGIFLFFKLS